MQKVSIVARITFELGRLAGARASVENLSTFGVGRQG